MCPCDLKAQRVPGPGLLEVVRAQLSIARQVDDSVVDAIASNDRTEKAGGSVETSVGRHGDGEGKSAADGDAESYLEQRDHRTKENDDRAENESDGDDRDRGHVGDQGISLLNRVRDVPCVTDFQLRKLLGVGIRLFLGRFRTACRS